MAKKTKSYSQVAATDQLEKLGQRGATDADFVYELLRIFAGYGDGQIRRTKEGPGNLAKDGQTTLIKNLIAYRPAAVNTIDSDCSGIYDVVNAMREDPKIDKNNPRLYVASNGVHVVGYDPKENDWYENRIELLWRDFEFFTPLAGIEKIQYTEEAEADVKSAELMAKLFDDIRRYNNIRDAETVHALNIFMSRLLFCFFAEDTGLFPEENLFTNTLKTHTKEDGSDLGEFIDRAFLAMSTNDPTVLSTLPKLYEVFPYVNGGLFRDRYPIPVLSRRARTLIINCGEYNWREINPDIFGSMIQAVVTPEQRAGLGMHYTSVPNIEKVIKPLFLDALEKEFEAACQEATEKMAKRFNADRASQRLRVLLTRLSNIKFFDPACGSGNFLIITYKRLRELEIRIWKALRTITNTAMLPFPNISLTQFYGIEIDEYACDTATLSLWLAEHQMNVKFQEELYVLPETLPLKPSGHIVCGNACRLDWNTVCPHTHDDDIMGNPPYVGTKWQNETNKQDIDIVMPHIPTRRTLDYIACWFIKASEYIASSNSKAAFVSTNSISQGDQVSSLWPYIFNKNVEMFFCHTSFDWSNNAKNSATVACIIVGLAPITAKRVKYIYSLNGRKKASNISSYLTDSENIIVYNRKKPLVDVPDISKGSQPTDAGYLLLLEEEATPLKNKYPNLSPYIRRYMGADDLINDSVRYCLWLKDCGDSSIFEIPEIKKRLAAVSATRSQSTKEATRKWADRPHLFTEDRQPSSDYLMLPVVSSQRRKYVPIAFNSCNVIANTNTQMIPNATLWLFALVTSLMHNVWMSAVCGRMRMDFAYSASIVYNTFPKLTSAEKEELERMAQEILNVRDENFDMTLGEMYNPESMPEALREAHHRLDLAVERIYRSEPFTSDEERLEHLFKLYAKMTKK